MTIGSSSKIKSLNCMVSSLIWVGLNRKITDNFAISCRQLFEVPKRD